MLVSNIIFMFVSNIIFLIVLHAGVALDADEESIPIA